MTDIYQLAQHRRVVVVWFVVPYSIKNVRVSLNDSIALECDHDLHISNTVLLLVHTNRCNQVQQRQPHQRLCLLTTNN